MKITCLLLLVAIMQVAASTYAQSTKLTLDMKNAKLSELFEEIENRTDFENIELTDNIKERKTAGNNGEHAGPR